MKLAGARILLESLVREGVDTLFGTTSGNAAGNAASTASGITAGNAGLFSPPLREALTQCPTRTVMLTSARGAIHAADGYARATGKPGVVVLGSGPDTADAIAALATAQRDSSPLTVFFIHPKAGGEEFPEDADLSGITRPCSKHAIMALTPDDVPRAVRQALYLSRTGRPGPVVVDLPETLLPLEGEFTWPEKFTPRGYTPPSRPHRNQLRRAVDELDRALRPLICVGGGAVQSGAGEAIARLAHACQMPVTSSLMGLGAFAGDDPLWLGMVGQYGTDAANKAAAEADLILAVGTRLDARTTMHTFGRKANIIHLDMEPAATRTDMNVNVPVPGDCLLSLECLAELLEKYAPDARTTWPERQRPWHDQLAAWRAENPLAPAKNSARVTAAEVMDAVNRLAKADALVTTGTGRHQMVVAAGRVFRESRTLLTPGGFPASAFGLCAAVGAQFALPHRQVIHVCGDGGFLRELPDLEAVTRLLLPVRILVLDNREADAPTAPDIAALALGFRLETLRVTRREDLMQTLKKAFAATGPVVVVISVEPMPQLLPHPGTLQHCRQTLENLEVPTPEVPGHGVQARAVPLSLS